MTRAAFALAASRAMLADRDVERGPIPQEAIAYFKRKGIKPGFDWRDVWGKEHDRAFTAAKFMREDVLADMQEELTDALTEGRTFKQFVESIRPRLEARGWWKPRTVKDPETGKRVKIDPPKRLRTIYETNLRVARAAGQWERIERNKQTRPYLLYQVGPSERHREQHLAWHGVLLPVDDPFWKVAMPPNGFGCKCHVRTVSKLEHKRLVKDGIPEGEPKPVLDDEGRPTGHVEQTRTAVITKAPKLPKEPWLNKRTGQVLMVPRGIQPGFDRRPTTPLKKRPPKADKAPARAKPTKARTKKR